MRLKVPQLIFHQAHAQMCVKKIHPFLASLVENRKNQTFISRTTPNSDAKVLPLYSKQLIWW